ncbi:MAG: ABC transporter permease [Lachnospiraceae bacterium]|nr:ABC transporter permease [Lachnospiraceae bacterium]
MSSCKVNKSYHVEILPKRGLFEIDLKEIWDYRDLILLFVKRTFVSQYKQTVLGPAWAVIQPLLTTIVFTVVFGGLASLPTDGIPSFLFYMCGTICWNYFSSNITVTSTTFVSNAAIFGKVYFPRLVLPISTVITNLISFAIQLSTFLIFWMVYMFSGNSIHPNWCLLLLPLLLLQMAMLSLGFGIIISALTTKYRDLAMLVSFGVQLWMYATPVAYSSTLIPEKWIGLYMLNPMTPIIETFRYGFLGAGTINVMYSSISWGVTILVLLIGVLLFNKVEKTFMDTI